MNADFESIERLARKLCEARNGPGSWDTKRRKRNSYRAQANRCIHVPGCGMADVLMAIFGFKRAAK